MQKVVNVFKPAFKKKIDSVLIKCIKYVWILKLSYIRRVKITWYIAVDVLNKIQRFLYCFLNFKEPASPM